MPPETYVYERLFSQEWPAEKALRSAESEDV